MWYESWLKTIPITKMLTISQSHVKNSFIKKVVTSRARTKRGPEHARFFHSAPTKEDMSVRRRQLIPPSPRDTRISTGQLSKQRRYHGRECTASCRDRRRRRRRRTPARRARTCSGTASIWKWLRYQEAPHATAVNSWLSISTRARLTTSHARDAHVCANICEDRADERVAVFYHIFVGILNRWIIYHIEYFTEDKY